MLSKKFTENFAKLGQLVNDINAGWQQTLAEAQANASESADKLAAVKKERDEIS